MCSTWAHAGQAASSARWPLSAISRGAQPFDRSVRGANPIMRLIAQVILMRYRDILRRSQMLSHEAAGSQSPELLEKEYAE